MLKNQLVKRAKNYNKKGEEVENSKNEIEIENPADYIKRYDYDLHYKGSVQSLFQVR